LSAVSTSFVYSVTKKFRSVHRSLCLTRSQMITPQLNYITVFIQHVYGSLWRWKHWSVRQI